MKGTPQDSTLVPFSMEKIREALVGAGNVHASPPLWASFLIKIISFLFVRRGESLAGSSQPPDLHMSPLSGQDKTHKEKGEK